MIRKQHAIGLFIIAFLCTGCWLKKEEEPVPVTEKINPPSAKSISDKPSIPKQTNKEKITDLYSSTPYDIPLFSVVEISKQPLIIQKAIKNILEDSQGFYLLKKENDKIVILLQNPITHTDTYARHELQFAEVDMQGNIHYRTAGYNGVDGEISNTDESQSDEWEFDESTEPKRPLTHTAYDEHGHIKYIEKWNYNEDEPIKYEMKNADEKVLSVLRETQDNDSNYRKEHVFYDNNGTTKMSLSVNYDGANISRMTFYNSENQLDSMSIISEYDNGLKTKELIYNNDYELVNTVTSDYSDGERKNIKVFDSKGNEIDKISS